MVVLVSWEVRHQTFEGKVFSYFVKEGTGCAMERVQMFGRAVWSLGIVDGAHWENCAELKRFGIFRRIGRNALPTPNPPPIPPPSYQHH